MDGKIGGFLILSLMKRGVNSIVEEGRERKCCGDLVVCAVVLVSRLDMDVKARCIYIIRRVLNIPLSGRMEVIPPRVAIILFNPLM